MKVQGIPEAVLKRLPQYHAYLKSLPEDEYTYISSATLSEAMNLGDVLVRKDLALISAGGRPKLGYLRTSLIAELEHFLGYDNTDDAVLIGAGKLGQALMDYSGFADFGMNVMAAFDTNPVMEQSALGKKIYPMEQLKQYIQEHHVKIGIITVPAECAQAVCDQLVDCGIMAIWNFAPVRLEAPADILVQNENLATSLAVIGRHLQAALREKK